MARYPKPSTQKTPALARCFFFAAIPPSSWETSRMHYKRRFPPPPTASPIRGSDLVVSVEIEAGIQAWFV
jgi:hypothetical protein